MSKEDLIFEALGVKHLRNDAEGTSFYVGKHGEMVYYNGYNTNRIYMKNGTSNFEGNIFTQEQLEYVYNIIKG